jgi:hypothetical protein
MDSTASSYVGGGGVKDEENWKKMEKWDFIHFSLMVTRIEKKERFQDGG